MNDFIVVAGPCALMNYPDRMHRLAHELKEAGATHFRAGIWKGGVFPPPANSLSWGMGEFGIPLLEAIHEQEQIEVMTEVRNAAQVAMLDCCSVVWTAARIMQDYQDLRQIAHICGDSKKAMALKRHPGATIRDWRGAIEHCFDAGGNDLSLWVVERGTVSISPTEMTRWRPDMLAITEIKEDYGHRIKTIFDVSHAVGKREWVIPMARAAVAASVEGLMVEVMDIPDDSPSDARQAIDISTFRGLMSQVKQLLVNKEAA